MPYEQTPAQKRYLKKHYAEEAELARDDQWSGPTNRLDQYIAINPNPPEEPEPTSDNEPFPF